jgi:FixJ family two-component response regulator
MNAKKDKVCLVDDEEQITMAFSLNLSQHFEVSCFNSAETALIDLEKTSPPEVIVSDLKMPIIDGFGFIEKLRATNKTSKIILATGYASKQNVIRALNMGVFSILEKPFTNEQLLQAVTSARASFAREASLSTALHQLALLCDRYDKLSEQYFGRIVATEDSLFARNLKLFENQQDLYRQQVGVSQERLLMKEIVELKKTVEELKNENKNLLEGSASPKFLLRQS